MIDTYQNGRRALPPLNSDQRARAPLVPTPVAVYQENSVDYHTWSFASVGDSHLENLELHSIVCTTVLLSIQFIVHVFVCFTYFAV